MAEDDPLQIERKIADPLAGSMIDSISNGGSAEFDSRLGNTLGPVGAVLIKVLQDNRVYLPNVHRGRDQVLIEIHGLGNPVHHLDIFQKSVSNGGSHTTADLAPDRIRVDGFPHIMGGPDLDNINLAGLGVDFNLSDLTGLDIGKVGISLPFFLVPPDGRRYMPTKEREIKAGGQGNGNGFR